MIFDEVCAGADPDDLTVMVCRLLRLNGFVPRVVPRIENGHMTAIEVRRDRDDGPIVAIFPCHPVPVERGVTAGIKRLQELA